MSAPQTRITDFFTLKKRSSVAEPPSKRRKVVGLDVPKLKAKTSPPKLPLTPIKSIAAKYKLDLTSSLSPRKANGEASPSSKQAPPLSPIEIKKRLGQVRKLSELQARLKELSSPEKQIAASPIKKELKFTYQVPPLLLSPKKALSPASPSKKPPAYLRHLQLTTTSSLLTLPKSYKKLLSVFSALDQIVSLRNNRGESIRLDDVFGPVQNVVRSEITMTHIEQIRCVFPSAFLFFWEKKRGRFGNVSENYELLIVPTDEQGNRLSATTPSDLVKRKTVFNNALLDMMKDLHAEFLLSFDPPIHIESGKIARWHKDFIPDTFCPDVDVVKLPEKPQVNTLLNVSDAMRETNKLFHSEKHIPEGKSSVLPTKESKDDEDVAFQEALKNRFEGINPALVKKILAKEKLKMEKELVTDKAQAKEKKQLDQLYDVARFLRSTFINEKKVALRLDFLLPRLLKSFSFNAQDMTKMVNSVSECAPSFLKLINIRNTEYAKLDKNVSLNLVESSINARKNNN